MYNVILSRFSNNHSCSVKALKTAYFQCAFLALGTQHTMPIAILSSVTCQIYNIFPHIFPHKWHDFRKNLLNTKCVFDFLYKVFVFSETFHILRTTERDMITNIQWSSSKVPVYSCPILMKLYFLDRFSKNYQMSNFMKICPVAAELFHTEDGRKGRRTKIIFAFRNFANSPKNVAWYASYILRVS